MEINKLFKDWYNSKSLTERKRIKNLLEKKSHITFNKLIKLMNEDGKTLRRMVEKLDGDSVKIRRNLVENFQYITEADDVDPGVVGDIDSWYEPISNRSNQMYSIIDDVDSDRYEPGLVQKIKQAVIGGNFSIAAELLKSGWAQLSLVDRNLLIGFVNDFAMYNAHGMEPEAKQVEKGGATKMAKLDKKSDKTKEEFVSDFLTTALENMKLS